MKALLLLVVGAVVLAGPAGADAQEAPAPEAVAEPPAEAPEPPPAAPLSPEEQKQRCLDAFDTLSADEQTTCRNQGHDPASYADEQVEAAAGKCSVGQPACEGVYDACREGTVTCDHIKEAACGKGATRCDERYLCTPEAVASICRFAKPRFDFAYTSLQYTMVDDPAVTKEAEHLMSVQSFVKGLWFSPVGLAYAVDMELGFGLGGGFLYEYNLGLGVGFRAGNRFGMGVTGGGGLSGFTSGRVPFAWRAPLEAFIVIDFDVGQLVTFARPAWVFGTSGADDRQEGSDLIGDLGGMDELTVGIGLTALGSRRSSSRYQLGYAGWAISLKMEEKLGTRFYGIGLGIGQSNVSE